MTFRATAGGLDAATMAAADARYLKLAADNDPLTGTLATEALQPDSDATRDIGTAALRYKQLFLGTINSVNLASGAGAPTVTHTDGSFFALARGATGTKTFTQTAGTFGGGNFTAATLDTTLGGSAALENLGSACVIFGGAYGYSSGTARFRHTAGAFGCSIFGYVIGNATVETSSYGCSFFGKAGANCTLSAEGAHALGSFNVPLTLSGQGGGAFGRFTGSGSVLISGLGGHFFGNTSGSGAVTISGIGAAGFGSAAGGTISATATNAVQFGPGTNAQGDSVSVGTQMRLKGTVGAPTTPRNGDLWVGTTDVNIRTVGVNLVLNRPTVTGSRVSGVALTNLLASLSTMNLILDSTTA